jgi:hypothetical protein
MEPKVSNIKRIASRLLLHGQKSPARLTTVMYPEACPKVTLHRSFGET